MALGYSFSSKGGNYWNYFSNVSPLGTHILGDRRGGEENQSMRIIKSTEFQCLPCTHKALNRSTHPTQTGR